MKIAYVFLAEGFEEVEALTPVDIMRRADIKVVTVGVTGKTVAGAHGIPVVADINGEGFVLPQDADLVMLPGGGPGTENLGKSAMVKQVLADAKDRDILIAAICAAPTVLHRYGLLAGKTATAFPTVQNQLTDAQVTGKAVEVDGKIITGRSAGVVLAFAQALVEALLGKEKAEEVVAGVYPGP